MMNKKQLIEYAEKVGGQIDKKSLFSGKEDNDANRLGKNQFRSLATMCKKASYYDEIELLLKYKLAKDMSEKAYKRSWAITHNNRTCGQVIIDTVKTICDEVLKTEGAGDKQVLEALSLFFGYMYWKANVWSREGGN